VDRVLGGSRRRLYYRSSRADNRTAGEGRAAASFVRSVWGRGPVSAGQASSAVVGSRKDPVRALQHALYRSAKADSGRRFHALRDKEGYSQDHQCENDQALTGGGGDLGTE
jgi:hypothetical protein